MCVVCVCVFAMHFKYNKPIAFISIFVHFYFGCRCTSNTTSRLPSSLILFVSISATYALQKQQVYRLDLYFCSFLFWLQVRFQYDKSAAFFSNFVCFYFGCGCTSNTTSRLPSSLTLFVSILAAGALPIP